MRPLLNKVNDPRGSQLAPRCEVSEFGCFRAAREIPLIDLSRSLWQQAGSELSFDYWEAYWNAHELLGTSQMPLEVERSAVLVRASSQRRCSGEQASQNFNVSTVFNGE